MRSVAEFVVIALAVTLTPGPATATILRVAARDGRRAAMSAVVGNSAGVLGWGVLSAVGISSLILASQIAYDVLRVGGAAVLVVLGVRSLFHRQQNEERPLVRRRGHAGWRAGLVTSVSNPKLAVFFVALFPQFLTRGSPVLPYALGMAAAIVLLDVLWFAMLAYIVERASNLLRPRLARTMERVTGAVMIGLGLRLVVESR